MWFFKKWFSKSKSDSDSLDIYDDADHLISFLEKKCVKDGISKAIDDLLKDYRNSSGETKLNLLPGLYLLFEQYLVQINRLGDHDLSGFRSDIKTRYPSVCSNYNFNVILQSEIHQEYLLCAFLLQEVLKKAYNVIGTATDNFLEESVKALESRIHAVINDQDHSVESLKEKIITQSKDLYSKLKERLGERLVINFYRSAYGTLSHNYRLLDGFPIILTLFPDKAMDDHQISLLNRDQMKKLLKEQVSSLQNANVSLNNEIKEREQIQKDLVASESRIKLLNEQLERQIDKLENANKELESFSYSVAHDLRAPLRAIDGFANMLLEDYKNALDDEGKRLIHVISGNVDKMAKLIDGLLTFSRLSRKSIELKLVNSKSIVSEVLNDLEIPNNHVHIADLPMIMGERELIKQSFEYLISNAVKFSRDRADPMIEIGCLEKPEYFEFYVKDNGIGFDMSYYNKLFGVFQTLHSDGDYQGIGIGLAITQKIITKHNGKIWAKGEPDKGATFCFSIPK